MINIMLDIETLGTREGAQVIQISAGAFETGKKVEVLDDLVSHFDKVVDLGHSNTIELDVSTLRFWTEDKETSETFNKLISNNDGTTEEQMIRAFYTWLLELKYVYGDVLLWGNGIIFDNVKIKALFNKYNLKDPIKYNGHRDVRTITEMVSDHKGLTYNQYKENFSGGIEKHNALSDVVYQCRYVTYAQAYIMGLPKDNN